MRLSADAIGVNAAKKTLEIRRKLKEIERRRCWDMGHTEFVPCFEDDGRTRKRSRELDKIMAVAKPKSDLHPNAPRGSAYLQVHAQNVHRLRLLNKSVSAGPNFR
jgi:hypothetical protein